ncbi:MAG TPA: HEAT repeat domain-containing protein [Polyangiaceae bacterium]|nr:HEAT repeat domain-containing protein [Polyangiaceae bacterium]
MPVPRFSGYAEAPAYLCRRLALARAASKDTTRTMGFFDLFKKDKASTKSNPAAKWAEAAGSKRAQNYDRQEALNELAALGTAEAAEALLKRFTFVIDPSITDQEEKEVAAKGVLAAGGEAITPIRAFAAKAESVSWPMRLLRELVTEDTYVDELLLWLSKWDTEYSKFIDPKLQILEELQEHQHPGIVPAVTPFIADSNETARLNAVMAVLAQGDRDVAAPLLAQLQEEESVRVKNKICDALAQLGALVPEGERDAVRKALPDRYVIDYDGALKKG